MTWKNVFGTRSKTGRRSAQRKTLSPAWKRRFEFRPVIESLETRLTPSTDLTAFSISGGTVPTAYGIPITFTATLLGTGVATDSAPSGTVQFEDNGASIGIPVSLIQGGDGSLPSTATFTIASSSAGPFLDFGGHTIDGNYSGDANYNTGDTNTGPPFTNDTQTITQEGTTTTLTPDAATRFGQTATLTVAVTTNDAGDNAIPSGSVDFKLGATLLDTEFLDASGNATFTTSSLDAGSNSIQAIYNPDTIPVQNFTTSNDTQAQVVNAAQTTTAITGNFAPHFGETFTYTATINAVLPGAGQPVDGTVDFSFDGGAADNVPVVNGVATDVHTWGNPTDNSHSVDATFNGDDTLLDFNNSTAPTQTVTVNPDVTTTVISSSSPTPVVGELVTYTATVASASPVGNPADGTVTFKLNGVAQAPSLVTAGVATITKAWGNTGSGHTVQATWNANDTLNDFATSTSTLTVVNVSAASTTTVITASDNTPVVGETVTYTASVTVNSPGSGSVTNGTVDFSINGGGGVSRAIGAGGTATITQLWVTHGTTFTVDATYNGDSVPANWTASSATQLPVTVTASPTTTTVSASSGNFTPVTGELVTYTATIAATGGGSGAPTDGTVTFAIGGVNQAPSAVSSGVATFVKTWAGPGASSVKATYNGNDTAADYLTSASATTPITVSKANTTTGLTPSDPTPVIGENVTWTASISVTAPGSNSPTAPSGNVVFTFDGGANTTVGLTGNTATFSGGALTLGSHTVTAHYNGDANFNASTAAPSSVVSAQDNTTTTVTFSPAGAHPFGSAVTMTATVAPVGGVGVPSGTVTFKDGAATLASGVTLSGTSKGTFSSNTLSAGTHTITAVYSGDVNFHASTSPNTNLVIAGVTPATAVSYSGTVTTAAAAASGATSITVNALFGALASGSTITFGATTVTLSAAAAQGATTLSVVATTAAIPTATTSSTVTTFLSGQSIYGQPNVLITASVGTVAVHPTAGSVLFTDILNSNVGSVTLSATAAANATSVSVAALGGALGAGQQFRFKNVTPGVDVTMRATGDIATLSAAAAAHATSLSVTPLAVALAAGTKLTFGIITVTLSAPALAGATTISVVDIGGTGIASGSTSDPANVVKTNGALAAGASALTVFPLQEKHAPGSKLTFGLNAVAVENAVSTTSTPTGATNGFMVPITQTFTAGQQVKFGSHVVTLRPVPANGFGQPTGSTYSPGGNPNPFTVFFFTAPTTFTFAPGDTYAGGLVGDTTIYTSALVSAVATGTASAVANPGATSIIVSPIGATPVPSGSTASVDNNNNPLFMVGAKTTFNVGLVAVNAGTGKAVLNESLAAASPLVLPGAQTLYLANGVISTISPLSNSITGQYVNGLLGGGSDPNFSPGATSTPRAEVISRVSTVTQIAVTPSPAQFGQTVTITGTVTAAGTLMPPIGTVTFTDDYINGGVPTHVILGTVALPTLLSITSLTRSGTTATATVASTATLVNNELLAITGASPSGYNSGGTPIAVLDGTHFAYTVSNSLTTPATGTILAGVLGPQPFLGATFTSAKATFTTASLAGGNPTAQNHSLHAVYNGDNTAPFPLPTGFPFRGEWVNSASPVFGEQVQADATTNSLTANPTSTQTLGVAVTFVDTLSSIGGTPHGGVVTFKDGTKVLGSSTVNIHGKATLVIGLGVPVGLHTLTAAYAGSGNFKAGTSNNLVYSVTPQGTTTVLSSASPGVAIGTSLTIKATVSGVAGAPTPTGTVVFVAESNQRWADGGPAGTAVFSPVTLGTATLAGGIATLAIPTAATGTAGALPLIPDVYEVEAFYSGDAGSLAGHTPNVVQPPGGGAYGFEVAVKDSGTVIQQLAVAPASPGNSASVTFQVRIRPSDDGPGPTITAQSGGFAGTIAASIDGGAAQPAVLINSIRGTVSVTVAGVSIGTHTIVLTYNGDAAANRAAFGLPTSPAGVIGWLPAAATTFTYTRASVTASAVQSPTAGSVAFSTAPKSTTTTSSPSTSSTTKSSSSGLSSAGVDGFFSATTTTSSTPRTLAGALAKAKTGEDWLAGGF